MTMAVGIVILAAGTSAYSADPEASSSTHQASLPADYWSQPLAPQGDAPSSWSELEKSINPESCGECHTDKYAEWKTSLHARAFSPGLVGQLITSFAGNPGSCMQCHAPLAEQIQSFQDAQAKGKGHDAKYQGLAASGNVCAACHLRGHKRFGPPDKQTGKTGPSGTDNPHGGVLRTKDFEKSEFCGACHQFPPSWGAVNGKPLENTVNEWKASPQAKNGINCQNCHMPDRKHLWRGIHDPKMVKSGLTAQFVADSDKASFLLTNTGVGHAFPTYVTPKATMHAVALDKNGNPRQETETTHIIQRSVGAGANGWFENFDTRLMPEQTATLDIAWQGSKRVRMWLEVEPDDFYHNNVYGDLLTSLDGEARKLIASADAKASSSRYRLFETEVSHP